MEAMVVNMKTKAERLQALEDELEALRKKMTEAKVTDNNHQELLDEEKRLEAKLKMEWKNGN